MQILRSIQLNDAWDVTHVIQPPNQQQHYISFHIPSAYVLNFSANCNESDKCHANSYLQSVQTEIGIQVNAAQTQEKQTYPRTLITLA